MAKKITSVQDLSPDAKNANAGTQRGRGMVEASLREAGAGRSILVDRDGRVIAGNKTLESAVDIGLEIQTVQSDGSKLIVVQRTDLDLSDDSGPARRLAYLDNRASETGLAWDAEQLLASMNDGLSFEGIFDQAELDALLAGLVTPGPAQVAEDPGAQTDRAEELQAKWKCADGDIWQIGEHFVICGDCREPATWQRLLNAASVNKVNGVFTSPPYAMQRKDQYGGVPTAEYVEWWEAVQANVKAHLASDGSFFVNIKAHCEDGQRVLYCMDLVCAMVRRWGWRFVDELCWTHEDLPGAWPNRFRNGFEPVYHFSADNKIRFLPKSVAHPSASVPNGSGGLQKRDGGNWTLNAPLVEGMAQPSNVVKAGGNTDSVSHSAAFPVALPDFFIRAYSDPGDIWFDPFCGSGTTIAAAHQNQRRGVGVEKLPKYMAVILERLQAVTECVPVRITSAVT